MRLLLALLQPDTDTARSILACNDPDQGVVAIGVRPQTRDAGWVARDLLAALGVRHDVTGKSKRDAEDRQLAPIWLASHQIADVLLFGVEALPDDALEELLHTVAIADCNLWLIADHALPDRTSELLAHWPIEPTTPAAFHARWLPPDSDQQDEPTEPSGTAALPPFPSAVPQVDFATFRAAARRQLPPEQFAAVDNVYVDAFQQAQAALEAGGEPLEVLRDILGSATSHAHTATLTRAVQAAVFTYGWHLRLDLAALLAFDDHAARVTFDDAAVWHALRAYRHPHRQVICILTVAGLAPNEQQRLTLNDIDADRPAVRAGGTWRQLPAMSAPALKALRLTLAAAAAGDDQPLLSRPDGEVLPERAIADVVLTAQTELGLRLVSQQLERQRATTDSWARRRGIAAAPLGGCHAA